MLSEQTFFIGTGSTTLFGCGAIDQVGSAVKKLGADRALIVTDGGVIDAGISQRVQSFLAGADVATETFAEVHPNPGVEEINAGGRAAQMFDGAVVVAIGGGSVLDVAKGIALLAANGGDARDLDYSNGPARPGLPVVAVPTTSGTGSETNAWGVIDDHVAGRKFYVGHESVAPVVIILDPELTVALPPRQTAATGMDTLAHALESLASKGNNPYAEGISLRVVHMVGRYLPRAVADGGDLEARSQMLLASHMAGLAFSTSGLGLGHALAHAVSARTGAAHGVALSVLMPHVMRFNLPVCRDIYARADRALGIDASLGAASAEEAVDAVRHLAGEVGMPDTLDVPPGKALIPEMATIALQDEVVRNNPRQPTVVEAEELLHAALRQS